MRCRHLVIILLTRQVLQTGGLAVLSMKDKSNLFVQRVLLWSEYYRWKDCGTHDEPLSDLRRYPSRRVI